jgi:hypothetical protein
MFKGQGIIDKLNEVGYVVIPFLSDFELEQLRKEYRRFEPFHNFNGENYHHSTFHTKDKLLNEKVMDAIMGVIQPKMDQIVGGYKVFAANFMIKESSEASEVIPHQDWTYVHETLYASYNIWIPLLDVNHSNGCMTVLPKSHNIRLSHRPSPFYPNIFEKVMTEAKSQMIEIPMKAGEAIIFNHATLHGSVPNISGKKRPNAVVGIYNQEAQLIHQRYDSNSNEISEYFVPLENFPEIAYDTYFDFHKPEKVYTPLFPQIDQEEFRSLYLSN